jgi:hypothetical protein
LARRTAKILALGEVNNSTKKGAIFYLLLSFLLGLSISCQRKHSSKMIGDLEGGSVPDAARKQLSSLGFGSDWSERTTSHPDDRRPRHDFIEMKGPFLDLGISGQLELEFYNDQLMIAQFIPKDPERYFKLLSEHLRKLPEAPAKAKRISHEVSLTYYRDPNGGVRFYWDYLPVSKEWQDWVSRYSFMFSSRPNSNS